MPGLRHGNHGLASIKLEGGNLRTACSCGLRCRRGSRCQWGWCRILPLCSGSRVRNRSTGILAGRTDRAWTHKPPILPDQCLIGTAWIKKDLQGSLVTRKKKIAFERQGRSVTHIIPQSGGNAIELLGIVAGRRHKLPASPDRLRHPMVDRHDRIIRTVDHDANLVSRPAGTACSRLTSRLGNATGH